MRRVRSHQPIAGARRPGPANTERFVTLAAPLLVAAAADYLAAEMLEGRHGRSADEPVWETLRAVFDLLIPHFDTLDKDSVAAPMQRVIFTTPGLLAGYLEKLQRVQELILNALRERRATTAKPGAEGDPKLRAVIAAAFGCLTAAQFARLDSGSRGTFATALDEVMAAVAPRA